MERTVLEGRVWILLNPQGKLIEDIDTDQIYHNAHLFITELSQMGRHAFGNLEGWKDFARKSQEGDIIIAGRNFGAGSSRQQAVDCFIALKVGAILAPSFSAIYFRNAVNSGFPVLKIIDPEELAAGQKLASGDRIQVDVKSGVGRNASRDVSFRLEPMSTVQYDIYQAGNLFRYGKSLNMGPRYKD
ncbi:MAG: 3-isopropylmalate dehydratase [Candidatus Aminicenantales bacterium]